MRRLDGELILFWTLPVVAIIWISAFFLFPGFLHPMSPNDVAPRRSPSFYQDETARIRYSMILFNWFGVGLIPIVVLMAMQIRRMAHRTPILSYCLIACAGGPPTIFLIANMFWLLASFRPERAPELTQLLNDLAWLTFTILVPYLIAQCLLLALAIFWDQQDQPIFKPWVAFFNLAIAVALAPPHSPPWRPPDRSRGTACCRSGSRTSRSPYGSSSWESFSARTSGSSERRTWPTRSPHERVDDGADDDADPPTGSRMSGCGGTVRYHPKRELWFAWWVMVIFYNLYGVLFFFVTHVQPPPSPAWDTPTVVRWFDDNGSRRHRRIRNRVSSSQESVRR